MIPDVLLQSAGSIIAVILFLIAVVTAYQSIVIVRAYEKRAYTRFGKFQGLLEPGPNFVLPFVTKTYTFDMRTQTLDVPRQEAITRDNSPVTADAVVYIKVMDAKKAFLEVDDYKRAVSNLAQTTLRAVLGDMELDDTLNKRQEINAKIRTELDEPTDEWGIRVESVEVREVNPSADVCCSIACWTSFEGLTSRTSTLSTRIPHSSVGSSSSRRIFALISWRLFSVSSSSMSPSTARSVVCARFETARL